MVDCFYFSFQRNASVEPELDKKRDGFFVAAFQ